MTHSEESTKRGIPTNKSAKLFSKLLVLSKNSTKIAPRKVLPASPIKTFAGGQLSIRKPKIAPKIGKNELSTNRQKRATINAIQEPTRPSIPSMKFIKFIIAVAEIK